MIIFLSILTFICIVTLIGVALDSFLDYSDEVDRLEKCYEDTKYSDKLRIIK